MKKLGKYSLIKEVSDQNEKSIKPIRKFLGVIDQSLKKTNHNLSDDDKTRIERMIKILGLNFANIINKRKRLLEDVINKRKLNIAVSATSTGEFPTAFQFLMNELK